MPKEAVQDVGADIQVPQIREGEVGIEQNDAELLSMQEGLFGKREEQQTEPEPNNNGAVKEKKPNRADEIFTKTREAKQRREEKAVEPPEEEREEFKGEFPPFDSSQFLGSEENDNKERQEEELEPGEDEDNLPF